MSRQHIFATVYPDPGVTYFVETTRLSGVGIFFAILFMLLNLAFIAASIASLVPNYPQVTVFGVLIWIALNQFITFVITASRDRIFVPKKLPESANN